MRNLALVALLLLAALNAFGHAGEVHKYMGTVQTVSGDAFTLATTDGKSVDAVVSNGTAYRFADGSSASRADLATGKRVVVTISTDGKTASEIKFAKR